jgi:hypothetical protein
MASVSREPSVTRSTTVWPQGEPWEYAVCMIVAKVCGPHERDVGQRELSTVR